MWSREFFFSLFFFYFYLHLCLYLFFIMFLFGKIHKRDRERGNWI